MGLPDGPFNHFGQFNEVAPPWVDMVKQVVLHDRSRHAHDGSRHAGRHFHHIAQCFKHCFLQLPQASNPTVGPGFGPFNCFSWLRRQGSSHFLAAGAFGCLCLLRVRVPIGENPNGRDPRRGRVVTRAASDSSGPSFGLPVPPADGFRPLAHSSEKGRPSFSYAHLSNIEAKAVLTNTPLVT